MNKVRVGGNLLPADFCRPSRECIEVALGIFPPPPPLLPPWWLAKASDTVCDCAEAVKCDKSKGPPVEADRLSTSFPLAIEDAIPGIGGGGGIGGGIASEDAP